jgi:hypothetical protein
MRRRVTQTFLVIAISLLIPIISTYFHYYDLSEADFLSHDISYENPDQEDLFMGQQSESKVFISSAFSITFPPGVDLLEQIPNFPFIICSLDQKTSVLRC